MNHKFLALQMLIQIQRGYETLPKYRKGVPGYLRQFNSVTEAVEFYDRWAWKYA